jgi:alpha-tubulin suppressor-like RCC1 family protein
MPLVMVAILISSSSRSDAQNVTGWGDNSRGQITIPSDATNVVSVAAGRYHSLALRADGTVTGWGSTNVVADGMSNVVSIAAGAFHSLALLADGTVVAWGNNTYGQITVPGAHDGILH